MNRILFYVLSWVALSLAGAVPYLFFGSSFTDALFESVSGFTATGTSALYNVSNPVLQLWRAATQWLGGIAFILMTLVYIFPAEKLHPRRRITVFWLCLIYILLTAAETMLLYFVSAIDPLNALCVSLCTVSTGGFYILDNNPIVTLFMFLAGVNYIIYIRLLSGKTFKVFRDEEFRFYVAIIAIFTMIIALVSFFSAETTLFNALRTSLFQVTSVVSTTDSGILPAMPLLQFLFILLMFAGASSGSAGGGIKIRRIALTLKNAYNGFRRFLHPNAIRPVRFDGKPASALVVNNAFLYLILYIFVVLIGVLLLTIIDVPLGNAINLVLTSLGNIGSGNLSVFPIAGKYILMLLMIVGRVELFVFLMLFSQEFWRK